MILLLLLFSCGETPSAHSRAVLDFDAPVVAGWELRSADFVAGAPLPATATCGADEGAGVSPDLSWTAPPPGTAALTLVVSDPKSRRGEWVHWLLFDMPPTARALPRGAEAGGVDGISDENWLGWSGPCPERGTGPHQVVFDLFALDAPSGLGVASSLEMLGPDLRAHTLARTRLTATTERVSR
jgi:Raf kinase inhibitor-like YbhB/YbcL family protein